MKTILLILCLPALCMIHAAEVELSWNANPATEGITSYEVTTAEVFGMRTFRTVTATNSATVRGLNAMGFYLISVTATNASGTSAPSECISLTVPATVTYTIQTSADMRAWADTTTTLTITRASAGFARIKIEINQ